MTLDATPFLTETQLWNAIVRHFGTALPLPAGQVVLTETTPPPETAPRAVVGVGPDIALTLAMEDFPFGRLTGVELTLDEVATLPPVLSEGLILGAIEALRGVLPPTLASQLSLPAQLGGPERPIWLGVELDLGSGAVARGRIGGRTQDFVQVLARLFPATTGHMPPLRAGLLQGLATDIALSAGEMVLPLAEVRALGPGDALLAPIAPDRRSFLLGRHEVVAVAQAEGGWTVMEIRMTAETPETAPEALSLDEVPLTLRFVTEDRRISLADLQGLAAGAVLPFEVTPLAAGLAVKIQANGATIGEGHLIQIDDSFAVRIARMVPKGA